MTQDRAFRRHLLAVLVGAAVMVLAQIVGRPPEGRFEVFLACFTAAMALIAVSLTDHEWRRAQRRVDT